MKKILLFTAIGIFVVFGVMALFMINLNWSGVDAANRPDATITIRFSNGVIGNERFSELRVGLFRNDDGVLESREENDRAPAANTFTRSGYTFLHWAPAAAGNVVEAGAYIPGGITQDKDGAIMFFAVWERNVQTTFRITLICNDRPGITFGSFDHTTGNPVGRSVAVPTRTGFTFLGFYDHLDQRVFLADGRPAFTGNWFMTSNHNLRAVWQQTTFAITFVCNDRPGVTFTNLAFNHTSGTPVGRNITPPTRAGFTFLGFYDHLNQRVFLADGRPSFTGNWFMTSNHTLRAMWTPVQQTTFTITFVCNDRAGVTYDNLRFNHTSGTPVGRNITPPTRAGFTFLGFYDHLNQRVFLADGRPAFTGNWFMTSNHTLRAMWRAN
ncbi:MAG: InlB B-repeat-containing protein [Firmicutes bacterium]|nr:InlB B-repeat-containing protein [Bacillota bacterium]